MSIVVTTGLAPDIVRNLSKYELDALNRIMSKKG